MVTNDVLRRLRFALRLNDAAMLDMMRLAGVEVSRQALDSYFLRDDEPGFTPCPKATLAALLDGMIITYRGPRDGTPEPPVLADLDNNIVLKKIRIALQLKEDDMIAIMKRADVELSRNELSALFRKKGQKNYMECMDQFLRNFLSGLAQHHRNQPRP